MPRRVSGSPPGAPSIRSSPEVGRSCPRMSRKSVDLPHPEGPTIVQNSPACTARSMFSKIRRGPYDLCRSSAKNIAPFRNEATLSAVFMLCPFPVDIPRILRAHEKAKREVKEKREERYPEHIRNDDLHRKVAPHEKDAVA